MKAWFAKDIAKREIDSFYKGVEEAAFARVIDDNLSVLEVTIKIPELFTLGAGTLVWALGDLIQFWPR